SLIQISAAVSPGSSGGAVVDSRGRLIGISTLIVGGRNAQNLNFAVLAKDVIAISEGIRAPLGTSKATSSSYYSEQGAADFSQKRYRSALVNFHTARAAEVNGKAKGRLL